MMGGRFADRAKADAMLSRARDKGFKGYVKKAFVPHKPLGDRADSR